jgi:hypothetical protein
MNKKQRMDEIYENLLWMANRPGVAIMAKYEDPYTGETVIFSSLKKTEFNKQIEEYAEKHPVE